MRSFVALSLPDDVRKNISGFVRECADLSCDIVKYVTPSNFHLTLKFIGRTEEEDLDGICSALSAIRVPPFEIMVKGSGMFPGDSGPRVLWVGADRCRALTDLHDRTDHALHSLGFPREGKDFAPHITIGRVKGRADPGLAGLIEENREREFGRFPVTAFALYRSDLSGRDPVYSIMKEFNLEDQSRA